LQRHGTVREHATGETGCRDKGDRAFALIAVIIDTRCNHESAGTVSLSLADSFDAPTKYVETHKPDALQWSPFDTLGPEIVDGARRIKATAGPDLICASFLREPDARNALVRFDERDVETECSLDNEAPADERAGNR
jgi:hypothetical protein